MIYLWRKIVNAGKRSPLGFSKIGNNAFFSVGKINPFETIPVEIVFPKGSFRFRKAVHVLHHPAESNMQRILQEEPVDLPLAVPLAPLPQLPAHEKELFAGMADHVAIEEPNICEFLPVGAGHLRKNAVFSMDDLIVGQDRHEPLGKSVKKAEGQIVLVEAA